VGVLVVIMALTHFLAISRVEVAYFISVKRTSLLFGIVYGALLFGERNLARNLGAGALMVAGVAMILAGQDAGSGG
jgi:drug/metabolite transporter (DMT)-like permease